MTSSCVRLFSPLPCIPLPVSLSSPPPCLPFLPPPSCLLSYFLHSLVYWLSAVASPFLGIMVDKLGFNLFFRESCFMGEKFRFGESGPSSPHAPSPPHPYPHTLIPTSSPPHSHLTRLSDYHVVATVNMTHPSSPPLPPFTHTHTHTNMHTHAHTHTHTHTHTQPHTHTHIYTPHSKPGHASDTGGSCYTRIPRQCSLHPLHRRGADGSWVLPPIVCPLAPGGVHRSRAPVGNSLRHVRTCSFLQ